MPYREKYKMRILVLFLTIFISGISYSQVPTLQYEDDSIFYSKPGFYQVTFLGSEKITGIFTISNGFTGYNIEIDRASRFKKTGFSCSGQDRLDSGYVKILNGAQFIFTSQKSKTSYSLYKLDDVLILVESDRQNDFIKKVQSLIDRSAQGSIFKIENKTYSANTCIAGGLREEYYLMEIVSDDGI
jgi:predicted nucleic-acid-binding Zn-ribbon protein